MFLSLSGCAASDPEAAQRRQSAQRLEVGGECVVADEVVEHTCSHASFGPFVSVTAQPYPGFVFTDVSAAHTSFTVALPSSGVAHQGAVLYSPGADGKYAIFNAPGLIPLVLDAESQPVPVVTGAAVPAESCPRLDQVTVFELSSAQTYTVVFGPSASPSVQAIIEFVGDGACETCQGVELKASLSLHPYQRRDAEASLGAPIAFEVPSRISAFESVPRVGTTTLSFRSGARPWVHCSYAAKPSRGDFTLLACSGRVRAGDDVEADQFRLRVNPGAALLGPITVELALDDEACHDHDHGHGHGEDE
jgi:hypothetical protein